jgi:hypothetical protein
MFDDHEHDDADESAAGGPAPGGFAAGGSTAGDASGSADGDSEASGSAPGESDAVGASSRADASAPDPIEVDNAAEDLRPRFGSKHFGPLRDADEAVEVHRLLAVRTALVEEKALVAASEARQVRLLAEASAIAQKRTARLTSGNSREREMALRSIALELGAAVRMNDRTMQARLDEAEQFVRLFPATVDALEDGRIDKAHAVAILEFGSVITDDEARAEYERAVIGRSATETPARIRVFARRLAEQYDPRTIDERFAEAHKGRRVDVVDYPDGQGELRLRGGATEIRGIHDRLTRQAKAIEAADAACRRERKAAAEAAEAAGHPLTGEPPRFDERTRDQVRADVAIDMLLTGAPAIDASEGGLGAIRAHVQITVPVTTLTGTTTGGGELNGRSPVDTETARRLAGGAPGWDRVMTDPVRGTVLEVDRYKPLASQERFLNSRDVRCRAPGCFTPAMRCDIDHNHEWHEGGRTSLGNLSNFCKRHHTLKTETEWTVRQLEGGDLEWTSPLGFSYPDRAAPRVVFVPDGPPPPL